MARVTIFNGRFDAVALPEAVDAVAAMVRAGARGWVATVNVATLMTMRSDPRLQAFVDRASLVVADGQPLVLASRWIATPLPERVAGIDLLEALFARAERDGFGVYLLGARAEVLTAAVSRIKSRWPRLRLCGAADGYFSEEEARTRSRTVAQSRADVLIVGMGVPRQERFLEQHWDELGATVAIGVGGSLDVLAGAKMRAPIILQRLGLEWLFRLAQEPRRLWKRYLVTNSQFLYLLVKNLLAHG